MRCILSYCKASAHNKQPSYPVGDLINISHLPQYLGWLVDLQIYFRVIETTNQIWIVVNGIWMSSWLTTQIPLSTHRHLNQPRTVQSDSLCLCHSKVILKAHVTHANGDVLWPFVPLKARGSCWRGLGPRLFNGSWLRSMIAVNQWDGGWLLQVSITASLSWRMTRCRGWKVQSLNKPRV